MGGCSLVPAILHAQRGGAQGKEKSWLTRLGWMDEIWIESKGVKENRKKM